MQAQLRDHQQAVDLFRKEESAGGNRLLRAYAGEALPMLEAHLHATVILTGGPARGRDLSAVLGRDERWVRAGALSLAGRRMAARAGAALLLAAATSCASPPPVVEPPSVAAGPCAGAALAPNPCALPPLSEAQARAALAAQGYGDVRDLQPVGDYWEGGAQTPTGPVAVYVFADGRVLHSPPAIGAP